MLWPGSHRPRQPQCHQAAKGRRLRGRSPDGCAGRKAAESVTWAHIVRDFEAVLLEAAADSERVEAQSVAT